MKTNNSVTIKSSKVTERKTVIQRPYLEILNIHLKYKNIISPLLVCLFVCLTGMVHSFLALPELAHKLICICSAWVGERHVSVKTINITEYKTGNKISKHEGTTAITSRGHEIKCLHFCVMGTRLGLFSISGAAALSLIYKLVTLTI